MLWKWYDWVQGCVWHRFLLSLYIIACFCYITLCGLSSDQTSVSVPQTSDHPNHSVSECGKPSLDCVLWLFVFMFDDIIKCQHNCMCICCCRASDHTGELHRCIDAAVDQLISLWDQIGIVGEQRAARYGVVLTHVRGLMEDMVQEETALRDRLVASIDKLHSEVTQLCTEMNLPQYEVYCSWINLLLVSVVCDVHWWLFCRFCFNEVLQNCISYV